MRSERPNRPFYSKFTRRKSATRCELAFPDFDAEGGAADADVVSQQLMLRAGMITKLAAGIYTYMPLGLRSIRKIEAIHPRGDESGRRHRVADAGVQPAELWVQSGGVDKYGPELLRLKDRISAISSCNRLPRRSLRHRSSGNPQLSATAAQPVSHPRRSFRDEAGPASA